MTLDPRTVARALGGNVSGCNVAAPGPGHSRADRSLSIKIDPAAPDGFILHSFAGDSPIACRDYVRAALGLGAWERHHPSYPLACRRSLDPTGGSRLGPRAVGGREDEVDAIVDALSALHGHHTHHLRTGM